MPMFVDKAGLVDYLSAMYKILFAFFIIWTDTYSQSADLTFQVDMQYETVSHKGVHVAGNFQEIAGAGSNWTPGIVELTDQDGDQIYTVTVQLPPGEYLYKYVNGDAWSDKPEMPSPDCAINDGGGNYNRLLRLGSEGMTLPVISFDSCYKVMNLSIDMNGHAVAEDGVFVIGDFQEIAGAGYNWEPGRLKLEDHNRDGIYSIRLDIPEGRYHFLFVNGTGNDGIEILPDTCSVPIQNFRARFLDTEHGTGNYHGCFSQCGECDPLLHTAYDTYWWNDVVFYEIFVRSFYDSDGDGIGDFKGLTAKLDYLNDGDPHTDSDLGIGGIWLMPMMPSPSYHGYDVTDYYNVEADYGTMADFEEFLEEAHKRGIKVIIDFVMNHTSSHHPWFVKSILDQEGYRDWYRWRTDHPGYSGPWGQNVWHTRNGALYYGLFWSGMPDLNYELPAVKEEMFKATRFWLDKGVDGFRLDAIKYLDEDDHILENTHQTFEILEEFNRVYKQENAQALTVGEVWSPTSTILPYVSEGRLDVCFEFDLAGSIINAVKSRKPDQLNATLRNIQDSYNRLQYATFLTNHDMDRIFSQVEEDELQMKMAASIYLTLPGIPFIYYGEEIGMTGAGSHPDVRRPMQWSPVPGAGFTDGNPWSAPGSNFMQHNVESMEFEGSLLDTYRKLVHLRNRTEALTKGYLLMLESNHGDGVLSYIRIYENEAAIMVHNLTSEFIDAHISLPVSTLPPGRYIPVDEMEGNLNIISQLDINSNGGFVNYEPFTSPLVPGESRIFVLKETATRVPDSPITGLNDIVLYPNPADSYVSLKNRSNETANLNYMILDINGRRVQAGLLSGISHRISLDGLSAGLYFVRLAQGKHTSIRRLYVSKIP